MPQKIITVRLSPEKDWDVINRLNQASSVSAYVKSLIARNIGIENVYNDDIEFFRTVCHGITNGICMSFNTETDSMLIEKLESVPSRRAFICSLVRNDIASSRGGSWSQLSEKIHLSDYRDTAIFASSRFRELAAQLNKSGCPDKAAEVEDLVSRLETFSEQLK